MLWTITLLAFFNLVLQDTAIALTVTLPSAIDTFEFGRLDLPCTTDEDNSTITEDLSFTWTSLSRPTFKQNGRSLAMAFVSLDVAGLYQCTVTGPGGLTGRGTVEIVVQYLPRWDWSTMTKFSAVAGQSAELICTVKSFPVAQIYWVDWVDRNITSSVKYGISVGPGTGTGSQTTGIESQSVLTVHTVQTFDYNTYTCVATNSAGVRRFKLQLLPPGRPDSPQSCIVQSVGASVATLICTPGYVGGVKTSYKVLKFIPAIPSSKPEQTRIDVRLGGGGVKGGVSDDLINVYDLSARTNYTLNVYAVNEFDQSVDSVFVVVATAAGGSDGFSFLGLSMETVIIIAGCAGGGLLVLICLIIVICCCVKRRKNRRGTKRSHWTSPPGPTTGGGGGGSEDWMSSGQRGKGYALKEDECSMPSLFDDNNSSIPPLPQRSERDSSPWRSPKKKKTPPAGERRTRTTPISLQLLAYLRESNPARNHYTIDSKNRDSKPMSDDVTNGRQPWNPSSSAHSVHPEKPTISAPIVGYQPPSAPTSPSDRVSALSTVEQPSLIGFGALHYAKRPRSIDEDQEEKQPLQDSRMDSNTSSFFPEVVKPEPQKEYVTVSKKPHFISKAEPLQESAMVLKKPVPSSKPEPQPEGLSRKPSFPGSSRIGMPLPPPPIESQREPENDSLPPPPGSPGSSPRSQHSPMLYSPEVPWEYPREKLHLRKKVGVGSFCEVWTANVDGILGRPGKQLVAVKKLKDDYTEEELRSLQKELDVMQILQPHPNLIMLLGCCSRSEPLYVIMEYAPNGSLLTLLRRLRSSLTLNNFVQDLPDVTKERILSLSSRDLTLFALHVASGMEYLTTKQLLHRDLAARSVLIDDQLICKIGDFGSPHDIIQMRQYEIKTQNRLPLRWMAPESLVNSEYSLKTDVWSFGILFWEIITLGSTPYPGLSGTEVLEFLGKGCRMDKLPHCTDKMHALMMSCWNQLPVKRPSFSSLKRDLTAMLNAPMCDAMFVERMMDNACEILHNEPGEKC